MKLVENWKALILQAYSMRAFYAAAAALATPEALAVFWNTEPNQAFWRGVALVIVALGAAGRLVEQQGLRDTGQ